MLMPGLLHQSRARSDSSQFSKTGACRCESIPRAVHSTQAVAPPGCIVFQVPKLRQRTTDIYSHSTYRKEYCNKSLLKQLKSSAQKKSSQRPHIPPRVENERFLFKTTAEADYRRYTTREAAVCKAKFPRTKRKEDFFYKPGEYKCSMNISSVPKSHDDHSPKEISPATYSIPIKDIHLPAFSEISCYQMDYKAPQLDAYSTNRKFLKRAKFD